MKRMILLFATLFIPLVTPRAEITIVTVRGEVEIRRGVSETWIPAQPGDVLRPEDSMRSGKYSSAVILVEGRLKLTLPGDAIVDMSDLRDLTQEELLLKLAMERVRSVPPQEREGEFSIPKTTTVHGSKKQRDVQMPQRGENDRMRLNGAKFLYDHRYYATSVLRIKSVLRYHPEVDGSTDARLMAAAALENMKLDGEALTEYLDIAGGALSAAQQTIVEQSIARLRQRSKP